MSVKCRLTCWRLRRRFGIVIRSFRHKGLAKLWNKADPKGVRPDLLSRVQNRLSVLNAAEALSDMDVPGFRRHGLQGRPKRHAIDVNAQWRITFEWEDGEALNVDLEQYH